VIYDTVIISRESELDLLECRFAEMAGLPVTHVIAESEEDYSGNPKPLHFWEEFKGRFAPWHGRWTHVRAHRGELSGETPGERRDSLRDFLLHGITGSDDDIVLLSAADEIPARRVIGQLAGGSPQFEPPVALQMRWCAYSPALVHPLPWKGTVVCRLRDAKGSPSGARRLRTALPGILDAGTRLSMWKQEVPEGSRHPDGHALWDAEPDDTYPLWVMEACGAAEKSDPGADPAR
jgi:hypothetical protein